MEQEIQYLEKQARYIRRDIVEMCHAVGSRRKAHPAPALSCADIMAALYFGVMRLYDSPKDPDRDRLILSKGHACPVLYAALYRRGVLTREDLYGLRHVEGRLQGHPDMKGTPGVDMTAGSLGHGLSAGVGMALAAKMDQRAYTTFVILGDGECQEGLVWEAAMLAPRLGLDNLVAVVDRNGLQSCGSVEDTLPLEPFGQKWAAFGWRVMEIDGHDMRQITEALEQAKLPGNAPTVILANTVKGKGVSFVENDNSWHQRCFTDEEFERAMKELEVSDG